MSQMLHQVSACSPSRQTGSYIYSLALATGRGLATITSADEMLVLDRQNLSAPALLRFDDIPQGVTCLTPVDEAGSGVLVAGRDGVVALFDFRTKNKVAQFRQDRPVTALTCRDHDIASGSELVHQQAVISVWDKRKLENRWQSRESNDDITDLTFHPTRSHQLLSGGVDGLVSIFDTNVQDEEESLLQVVNHSPIHKAGFLSEGSIYALSSDEQLSIHAVTTETADDDEHSPPPVVFGDIRPTVPCEYVIDIIRLGDLTFVAAASHSSNPRIDLVPIRDQSSLELNKKITLAGAHGGEIVRAVVADAESGVIFTAGEDGQIRAFRQSETPPKAASEAKSSKARRLSDVRFRPY